MYRSVQAHPYHLVEPSPWPLLVSLALLTTTLSAVLSFHGHSNGAFLLSVGLIATVLTMTLWFISVAREATLQGHHTIQVQKGLAYGFLLFVISEVFFFISVFWGFYHSALAPTVELGAHWPPAGIEPLNPFEVPLLNTVILLSSGATVTYAHHSVVSGDRRGSIFGLCFTLLLAVMFTLLQGYEYYNAPFTISDGVYGSTFYMATGFHAVHVILGTLMLFVVFFRLLSYHFTDHHHLGLETAILYWHFVDLVWLLLFLSIYWWGGDAPTLGSFENSPLLAAIIPPYFDSHERNKAIKKASSLFPPTTSKAIVVWGTNMGSSLGLYVKKMAKYMLYLYQLPYSHKCVLFGILLSDGHLEMGTNLARFSFIQSIPAHISYFWAVFFTFMPFCNSMPRPSKIVEGTIVSLIFKTRALPCFTEFYTMFYKGGIKRIPDDSSLFAYLTPEAIAHMVAGDGSWNRTGVVFCTDSFSLAEVVDWSTFSMFDMAGSVRSKVSNKGIRESGRPVNHRLTSLR